MCCKSRNFEKEKNMIIDSPYYESEKFKNMNNEFKVNVDEQQDDIKHLKEYCDIDEIKPLWKEMDVCVTCNQTIANKFFWKIISRKSTLSCCEIIVAYCSNK